MKNKREVLLPLPSPWNWMLPAMAKLAKYMDDPSGIDDSEEFQQLSAEQQRVLVEWIRDVMVPAKRIFPRTSYGMKHDFENFDRHGFYVTNGQFKGAMLAAGFSPVDRAKKNWQFRVKPARELNDKEKRTLNVIGTGWLVRSSKN